MRLLLFDIDGTLVLSGGAGARAMARAFAAVFGVHDRFEGVPMNGRTDTWIVSQVAALNGVECTSHALGRFHDSYIRHLVDEMPLPGPRKGVMPGVRPLLDALSARSDVCLALLTGNFEAGARVKLEYFDLWRYFICGAFGDHAYERNQLLGSALARVEQQTGLRIPPADTVIIGDTPLDVAVAVAGGARSLAVATGSHDVEALKASGADAALEDLTNLPAVLEAIGLTDS